MDTRGLHRSAYLLGLGAALLVLVLRNDPWADQPTGDTAAPSLADVLWQRAQAEPDGEAMLRMLEAARTQELQGEHGDAILPPITQALLHPDILGIEDLGCQANRVGHRRCEAYAVLHCAAGPRRVRIRLTLSLVPQTRTWQLAPRTQFESRPVYMQGLHCV